MATNAPEVTSAAKPNPVIAQVEGSIRWILRNQEKGAELQLHPENLGRITISLKVEGTVVHARLWASEASTLPLLQEHRAHLEQSLKQQGLNLGSFDLQSGSRGRDTRSEDPNGAANLLPEASRALEAKQEMPVILPSNLANGRRIEVYA